MSENQEIGIEGTQIYNSGHQKENENHINGNFVRYLSALCKAFFSHHSAPSHTLSLDPFNIILVISSKSFFNQYFASIHHLSHLR